MSTQLTYEIKITIKDVNSPLPTGFIDALQVYLQERARITVKEFELNVNQHILNSRKVELKTAWGEHLQNFEKQLIAERNMR
jgi:hypothetical protein